MDPVIERFLSDFPSAGERRLIAAFLLGGEWTPPPEDPEQAPGVAEATLAAASDLAARTGPSSHLDELGDYLMNLAGEYSSLNPSDESDATRRVNIALFIQSSLDTSVPALTRSQVHTLKEIIAELGQSLSETDDQPEPPREGSRDVGP